MIEIKYRGKSLDNGEWKKGSYERRKSFVCNDVVGHYIYGENSGCLEKVDRETVGQFIGRKDNYGSEIFEGDILLVNGKVKKVVSFVDERCAFCLINVSEYKGKYEKYFWEYEDTRWWSEMDVKVIGNVFDNSDLIKE